MSTPARYWREIPQRYRYEGNRCKEAGESFFPPRLICPKSKGQDFEQVILPTEGVVITQLRQKDIETLSQDNETEPFQAIVGDDRGNPMPADGRQLHSGLDISLLDRLALQTHLNRFL